MLNESGEGIPRFSLFAAHDTTLNPLLASIGAWDEQWAPYASMLVFEMWVTREGEAPLFRALYNGKALQLAGCSSPLCELDKLQKAFDFAEPLEKWKDTCAIQFLETSHSNGGQTLLLNMMLVMFAIILFVIFASYALKSRRRGVVIKKRESYSAITSEKLGVDFFRL